LVLFFGALFLLVAPLLRPPQLEPQLQLVQDRRPEIVQPTGRLLEVYQEARAASLRLEARCEGALGSRRVLGVGSGFYFTADGAVLTAYHVVDSATTARDCQVGYVGIDPDRNETPLTLVGFDAYLDLAVMRAEELEGSVPFIPIAERLPKPGSAVVAIGNSGPDFIAARAGVVTRLGVRAGRADFADNTIELTNALAPGDSGGPVVNEDGEAVGVVSYISFNPTGMRSDMPLPPFLVGVPLPQEFAAYAVPVAAAPELVAGLSAGSQRDVPVIGFTWQNGFDYDPRRADVDLGPRPGPIVGSVASGGPADRAGLRPYLVEPQFDDAGNRIGSLTSADVIVAVDGVATPTFASLLAEIRGKAIGQEVVLTVQRGPASYRLTLELASRRSVFAVAPSTP
jgi:S1-C subfamily serine protease